ncbi:class I SAM-dependent methyltransferase [Intrasporangium sp.]|uniref:class I SAM-dependent methyltransferase n=1 Tax=Intrasporangium sp. TaxID=1925024 RepID=UPI00293A4B46|nr:methyltransferase domain-containing protein [Intrasporangium sp.]MDV3222978.1 methyltransferase domain-containing protein [Intrasporangium sp.]
MTTTMDPAADAALKAKHAAMWALGDYPRVARQLIPGLGTELVEATRIRPGDRVLDVAAGPGNAAVPAALAGADVVASDLTPELIEAGRAAAEKAGARLEWRVADAEAMPFGDAEFDVVVSCVGVMFAPHHERAAAELARVTRPGGRLGLISWTPEGFIGQMLAVMKPYAAPPPPGSLPPPLWGREEHVRELLGGAFEGLSAERRIVAETFEQPGEFREFFKANYGPTIATYRFLGDDAERAAALDAALDALVAEHSDASGRMEWEYLLVTGTRAG